MKERKNGSGSAADVRIPYSIEREREKDTDMEEKAKARLRESRLLTASGHGGEFTQPSLRLFLHVCSSW